ncbi:P-loop containing nucleoside triphosphate hydrolase protein [Amylostereum chailletii]|nr:P-loop containing nucleoside triphosphate hydrolase protein [Amylostereum chailletii]
MGLGKTIQVISFLSAIMHKTGTPKDIDRRRKHVSRIQDGREWREHRKLPPPDASWPTALVIVPSSVVGVWAREFPKWGYFEVGVYTGTADKRDEVLNDFKLGRLDVVITSFDIARLAIDSLDDLPWSVLIVDEAHRLKNPKSKSTLALSSFQWSEGHPVPRHISRLKLIAPADSKPRLAAPRTGPIRIALTGTAIQNSYFELWTLLDWANPGSVGTMAQWKKAVADPLTAGQAKGCSDEVRLRANDTAHALAEKLLPNFFLRRTKDIIKDQLPKKFDEVVFCPLTWKQSIVYKRILATDAVQNMVKRDELCDCGSKEKRKECCHPFVAGDLFKYMSTLIKISNHLALILPTPGDTQEQNARNRELSAFAFPNGNVPKYGTSMLEPDYCGKWKVYQSVKLITMLEFHLENQSYKFVKLDGSTKASDRMPLIDKFQQDPEVFVFLISTLAGGTGLNLTAANKVVVFDPAHDLQAMDRAYRFGQMRDVSVYRLLGAGSIEELIYARQVYKQQQMAIGYEASTQTRYFSGVSGDKSKQGELFGLQNIFKLHEDTSTTKMAIERANVGNLDWALGHMDVVKSKAASKKKEAWVYETEAKELKEDADLKGLGALLFDDSVPQARKGGVTKILDSYGIKYSHRNDELLAPSHIDKERDKIALQEIRERVKRTKREKKSKEINKAPEAEWPPRRKHHKISLSPKSKLAQRQKALIDLGMIQTPADLPVFAQNFAVKSQEEQNTILSILDEHTLKRR